MFRHRGTLSILTAVAALLPGCTAPPGLGPGQPPLETMEAVIARELRVDLGAGGAYEIEGATVVSASAPLVVDWGDRKLVVRVRTNANGERFIDRFWVGPEGDGWKVLDLDYGAEPVCDYPVASERTPDPLCLLAVPPNAVRVIIEYRDSTRKDEGPAKDGVAVVFLSGAGTDLRRWQALNAHGDVVRSSPLG